MSSEERSLHIFKYSCKKIHCNSWCVKFLAHGNWRGYKKLLVGEGKTFGVSKMSTQNELEMAEHGLSVQDKAVKKCGKLYVLTFEDILLFIDAKTSAGKAVFNFVNNATLKTFLIEIVDLYWTISL